MVAQMILSKENYINLFFNTVATAITWIVCCNIALLFRLLHSAFSDCLGAVMSLTRLDEPINTSCQYHHCHDDGDDGIGDDDGGHNDHDHSHNCDDATADATWHS